MGGSHKQSDIPVILLCHCPCCRSHSHHHHHHHYYVFIVIIIMMIIINHNQFENHHHPVSVFKSRSQRVGENIVSASISCSEKKIEEISEIFFFSYLSNSRLKTYLCSIELTGFEFAYIGVSSFSTSGKIQFALAQFIIKSLRCLRLGTSIRISSYFLFGPIT